MPTYQFRCPDCTSLFEERRSFAQADDPVTCPSCEGARASKVIASATFFSSGSAAKALLESSACGGGSCVVPAGHGTGCPCCSGGRAA